jgi:uncharacterized membrane protein
MTQWTESTLERLGIAPDAITAGDRRVLSLLQRRLSIGAEAKIHLAERPTFGQSVADSVARVGGSWAFIIGFGLFLAVWVVVNTVLFAAGAFDPYPFIFLNLLLSMLAALQAPVIMMSQNRQSLKDRIAAEHDYEVNLKAELEIMALHDKLDRLRTEHLEALMRRQEEQMALLTSLVGARPSPGPSP